jgi:ribosomal protein L20
MTRKRHKRSLKKAAGYWGARHRWIKTAKQADP